MASNFDLPKLEEKILKFWKDRKIFERTLENRARGKRFTFFEGPPFPNAKAHVGNVFTRCCKDVICRYKNMRGFNVVGRRTGWDVHGLPVELQLEKQLGLKGKPDIEKYGIAKFNKAAREMVWGFKDDWDKLTERIGFWIDIKNPYITSDPSYIETLWHIISCIWKKNLFYKDFKVVPYCPRCGTTLSNFEVAQGYEKVTETSLYLKFKVKGGNSYILSWTTTPWTLPGNVALAVNPSLKYVKIEARNAVKSGGAHPERSREGSQRASTSYGTHEFYILAEQRLEKIKELLEKNGYKVKANPTEVPMHQLLEMKYEPLFEIPHLRQGSGGQAAYKVYPADFVTADEGTGVVHTAVMYGEDDYSLGIKVGLPKAHTVDETGKFVGVGKELDGKYVKSEETERIILEHLRKNGNLLALELYEHDYPFCWRCKSPLLYYARDSWFVAMSKLRKQLLKNNEKVNWVPAHLKHGRFGEFLNEVKDWAFSRERFWGTPLPVWRCEKCGEYKVVGSLDDLEKHRYRGKNTYFLLRHGLRVQSHDKDGQELSASQLALDKYDLTREGVKQIEEVAEKIKESSGLDLIFSSPFLRTRRSAEIIAKKLGLEVKIDNRLKEIDEGPACEGKPRAVCLPPGEKLGFDYKFNGGESWRDVRTRMFSVIREIDEKYEGKKVLLVSHGDPLWLLDSLTKNLSEEEIIARRAALYVARGELRQIDFKNLPYNEFGELDVHRPYVDKIFLRCEKCRGVKPRGGHAPLRGKMARVKEVVDVWFDSGAMPFAQYHWPFEKKLEYPADFISEGVDQTRGWFYTLHAVGTLMGKGPAFKNVLSLGHILDEKGEKMSKSKGNIIDPWEVIGGNGVDVLRWYFFTANDSADPKLFSINAVKERSSGFVTTLLNSLRFFELYEKPSEEKPESEPSGVLDEWVLSKINGLARAAAKSLDEYDLSAAARAIESFVIDDLSNWWLRRSRGRFQRPQSPDDFERGMRFFRHLLSELSKLLAPFTPFLADHIYKKADGQKESVHLENWPKVKKKLIKPELEKETEEARKMAALGLAQRKAHNIKVRQPLAGISLKRSERFGPEMEKLIMDELNIKAIAYNPGQKEEAVLDKKITPALLRESYAREIIRQIQDMRKEAGYKLNEKIYAAWASDSKDVIRTMRDFGKEIAENTLLAEFSRGRRPKEVFDVEKEFELGPQVKIWLGVRNKK